MTRARGALELRGIVVIALSVVVGGPLFATAPPAFAAAPEAPQTDAATGVTTTTATLHGVVNPTTEADVHWSFAYAPEEYGPECVDAFRTTEKEAEKAAVPESVEIAGLEPHRKYTFCLTASNSEGETRGNEVSFETKALAPEVAGQNVPSVTPTTVRVEGLVNAENESTTCTIQYGTVSVSEKEIPCEPGTIEGYDQQPVGASIAALEANTPYKYRILTKNATGEAEGAGEFTTPPQPPLVSTGGVVSLAPTIATISASVNPNAAGDHAQDDTTYLVEYGGTVAYGEQTAVGDAGEGTSAVPATVVLADLEPGRTYHYRIVASNDEGRQTVYGEDATLTTPSTPPAFSGVSVSGVTQSGATIAATVEPNGLPTRYELLLGGTPGQLQPAGSGNASTTTPLSLSVESLTPGTTYYYKLTAMNPDGPSEPEPEGSFTTVPAPAGSAPAGLPATLPYQSIAELNAKETKEDKGIPNPTITRSLTNAQKLNKALKACHAKKGKQRASCEKSAHKKYGATKRKHKKK